MEAAAEALAALNPTPDAARSDLLLGAWTLLYSGRMRGRRLAAGMPAAAAAGPSLQQALRASSDRLYSVFYQSVPLLAGSAVGARRGPSATNTQALRDGRVDNIVSTKGGLRLCVSGSYEAVSERGLPWGTNG